MWTAFSCWRTLGVSSWSPSLFSPPPRPLDATIDYMRIKRTSGGTWPCGWTNRNHVWAETICGFLYAGSSSSTTTEDKAE